MNRKEVILLLFLLTCFTFFVQWTGAEQRSFFSLTLALHNERSLIIDRYADLSPDKALYDGHYYSDKAPGLSFLALPVFAVLNALQNLNRPGLFLPYTVYMVSAWVVALPSALLALLIVRFLRHLNIAENQAIVVALVMALGTLAFPFSTLLFSHQTSAFFVFAAFMTLFLARRRVWPQRRALFAAGLLAGSSVVLEYPMAIMAMLLLIYAWTSVAGDKRDVAFYVLGGIPLALALLAYNTAAFDHPLHFSYFYQQNTWAEIHKTGILGLGLPQISTFLTVVLGPRGLFTLSPVLILTIYGFYVWLAQPQWRAEGALALAGFTIYLLMTSGYRVPPTDIWVPGPRFLVPVLPFLAAPLAMGQQRWPRLFVVLAAASVAVMFIVTAANPQIPPDVANPLFQHWLPGFFDRSQLVHTLPGLRYGVSRGFGLLLLASVIVVAGLACLAAWRWRARQSQILGLLAVFVAVAYLAIAFPIDLRNPFDVPASLRGPQANGAEATDA